MSPAIFTEGYSLWEPGTEQPSPTNTEARAKTPRPGTDPCPRPTECGWPPPPSELFTGERARTPRLGQVSA